jgi:simple sugar transport system ATP-binding protein
MALASLPDMSHDPTQQSRTAISAHGVSKSFFGFSALTEVDFSVQWGQVHALLGENGAGKSSLCSIFAGLYRPDAGDITVGGASSEFHSPHDALRAGVGMVYQHYRLVESFTVAENLVLGHPDVPRRVTRRYLKSVAVEIMGRHGMELPVDACVGDLSVGEQQRVEILRLLHRGVRVLILDEPTAVLTPQESEALFTAIRTMTDEGKAVVFISHKLGEVLRVSDQITVLRSGRNVGTMSSEAADTASLAALMVGDTDLTEPEAPVDESGSASRRSASADDGRLLSVTGVSVTDDRGLEAVRGVELTIDAGEIVGLAGVAGNGQRELCEAIAGMRPTATGAVVLAGQDVTHSSVRERVRLGLGFVPEDRLGTGVAPGLPVEDNLALRTYRRSPISAGPVVRRKIMKRESELAIDRFDIRGVRPGLPASVLSGGNLQRVILARELRGGVKLLIAAAPTRGLDVRATHVVHDLLRRHAAGGGGVLFVSEDLDELLSLADRVVVLYEGRIAGAMPCEHVRREEVGLLMAGVSS